MVRYLDIWDTLNSQGDHNAVYRNIITSIMQFPRLQHFPIVISGRTRLLRNSELWNDRTYSWFDSNEWKHNQVLTREAVPKIRSEDIEIYWPELEILKRLKAQKFTLAVETPWATDISSLVELMGLILRSLNRCNLMMYRWHLSQPPPSRHKALKLSKPHKAKLVTGP